jgi:2'-5' RNA ligase
MDIARLFVGLPLPESYQDGLAALTKSLKYVVPGSCSWTRPGSWHVTLKFLGDVPMDNAEAVRAALAAVAWKPFAFRAGGAGFFPNIHHPRVAWVGAAEGGAACIALAAAIEAALTPLGFAPDSRPFSTHLTVARIKSSPRGADWHRTLAAMLAASWPDAVMDRFVLWRSYLGNSRQGSGEGSVASPPGPRHVPLWEFGASG